MLDPDRWKGHPLRSTLQGALVVVGPALAQGDDGYLTPFGPLSGLEMLATATANSLDGSGLRPWPRRSWPRALLAALPVLLGILGALRWSGLAVRLGLVAGLLVALTATATLGLWQANRWLPLLPPAVGLASGEAMVGQISSPRRMEFTVMGDIVNLADRPLGCQEVKGMGEVVAPGRSAQKR